MHAFVCMLVRIFACMCVCIFKPVYWPYMYFYFYMYVFVSLYEYI